MSDPFDKRPFPRGVLIGAGVLIGFAMLAVAVVRFGGLGPEANVAAVPVERLSLRFEDRPDGAVVVRAADDGHVVRILEPGTNGFVRGVLRGLARDRMLRSVGPEPPFHLALWADGRLTLTDSSTGREIDLNAFGTSNLAAFAQLIEFRGHGTEDRTAALGVRIQAARSNAERENGDGRHER